MLYDLTQYLAKAGIDIPGMGLFGYLSFRAIAAFALALLISIFAGRRIIAWLQKKQIGETIRDLGLEGQMQKKGTPTMGGIIIFISLIIPVLLLCDLGNIYSILLVISTVWFFLVGFADDYIKVFRKNKEGMSEKAKLMAQGMMALAIGLAVCFSGQITVRENTVVAESSYEAADSAGVQTEKVDIVKSTKTTLPFVKNHEFDYSWLSPFKGSWGWYCKWAIYVLMIIIVITACSNGVNLTDGMDGLAAGTSAIVGVVLGIFAWLGGNIVNAEYLNIMYIPGSGEVAVFMSALVGALIGFLWYNTYPAQVFMGDTGSLALGGFITGIAYMLRLPLFIPIVGFIYMIEVISVIIQVAWFRRTGGKRFFRMAPIHHHFELGGWSEVRVVAVFTIVTAVLGAVAILAL